MTERDLIREVVEKYITRTVDIEVLRKWIKERYEKERDDVNYWEDNWEITDVDSIEDLGIHEGKADLCRELLTLLDRMEAKS